MPLVGPRHAPATSWASPGSTPPMRIRADGGGMPPSPDRPARDPVRGVHGGSPCSRDSAPATCARFSRAACGAVVEHAGVRHEQCVHASMSMTARALLEHGRRTARVARSAAQKLACIDQANSSSLIPRNPCEAHPDGAHVVDQQATRPCSVQGPLYQRAGPSGATRSTASDVTRRSPAARRRCERRPPERALARQRARDRQADSLARARHDRNLVLEPNVHGREATARRRAAPSAVAANVGARRRQKSTRENSTEMALYIAGVALERQLTAVRFWFASLPALLRA